MNQRNHISELKVENLNLNQENVHLKKEKASEQNKEGEKDYYIE